MFKPIIDKMDFVAMEKKWLKHWYENGIVKKYLNKNKNSKKYFSFLDGPITANNPMGVHHAWGRTYKDLWPKFYNLLGYKQRFQNGFDCQGLWVEVEVEKELGIKTKKDIENLVPGNKFASIAKFVQLCKDRVYRFSKIQTEQSKRLGYFADWENSYFTMSDENNYMFWTFLKKCYENGWIYKGQESVPWCPRCQTAISEHEILTEDYKEVVHEAVYFKLKVKNPKLKNNEYFLVWTTTPWTIPANVALAVEKDFDYSLVEIKNGEHYWLAKDLIEKVLADDLKKIVKIVKGEKLAGLFYQGPFDHLPAVKTVAEKYQDKFHQVILTDKLLMPINLEEGTGIVHTAVSAGTEDFRLGKKLGLPMIPVIDDEANYLPGLDEFSGKNAKKNPRLILDYLEKNNYSYKVHHYKHRYPACWRCKTELVWKVAEEWYIAMDKKNLKPKTQNSKLNKTLRERMIEVAKKIKWMPEFGLDRELDWLKNMHDWLISKKNRFWGLSLPIYECKKCGYFEIIGSKEELKEKAVEGWEKFEGHSPHKPYIDEVKIKCQKCGSLVSRIDDVGNPWLDAGIVAYSTITENNQGKPLYKINKEEWKKWFPADFITESFPGQFKNWFYALIAMSTVMENQPPFKRVLGYGTLLGEDGRPMHKSWGNAIEFNEGADKIGVDVMRWMFVRQNPSDNMLFGYKKADEVRRQFYLILWNIYKFFVEYINLDKIEVEKLKIEDEYEKLNILDKWILSRFVSTVFFAEESLKNFNAKDAVFEIEKFISDLSTWYIRRSRDRVWVNSENNDDKKAFYSTLHYLLVNLAIILSPFLPFISEEIFTNLTNEESVHLTSWPKLDFKLDKDGEGLISDMDLIRKIVEMGHRKRKELKIKVRQPLASLTVLLPDNERFKLKKYENDYQKIIASELNVKKVFFKINKDKEIIDGDFDAKLTKKLILEGKMRETIRLIQEERKKLGAKPEDYINLTLPVEFENYQSYFQQKVRAKNIFFNSSLKVDLC
ncbi:MAG: isoleucine--tRNA ligase [Patescibacteria group bacterium]|nr:isoleucine--tRNA ligase [Patescibacteria group bacterium]